MKEYFILQYRMSNRRLKDFGVIPLPGYVVICLTFLLLSMQLFDKTTFAPYIYSIICFGLLSRLSDSRRNDFLKIYFKKSRYYLLRVTENVLIALPFLLFLVYKQLFSWGIGLAVISGLFSQLAFSPPSSITIPTPFYRRPFEFIVGFRTSFYILAISYGLSIVAIVIDNFNLSIFSLLLVFFVICTYYLKPENEYYVWSYNLVPRIFLLEKMKTAMLYTTLICLPIIFAMALFYPKDVKIVLLFALAGYLYLATIILAKYAAYPSEINLPQFLLIIMSLFFPPLLLAIIPYFLFTSFKRLKFYLG